MRLSRRGLAVYGLLSAVTVLLILFAKNSKLLRLHHNPGMLRIVQQMGSLNWTEVVKPGENTILLEPTRLKMMTTRVNNGSSRRPLAVILVTTLADSVRQRQAVRDSWGKWAEELDMKVYFAMGFGGGHLKNETLWKDLVAEQRAHDDLLVDNFEEGYYRLTGKMLRMLKWYSVAFSDSDDELSLSPRFLIKTDHDVFLNLPNIASILKATPYYNSTKPGGERVAFDPTDPHSYFLGGKRFNDSKPDPDPSSKWHLTSAEMKTLKRSKLSVYPQYANGACYVISGNVVGPIYAASFSVPLFPFEDAYLTGLVAHEGLNLSITHMPEMWDYESLWRWNELGLMLMMHPVDSPALMQKIWGKVVEEEVEESSKNSTSLHSSTSTSSSSARAAISDALLLTMTFFLSWLYFMCFSYLNSYY